VLVWPNTEVSAIELHSNTISTRQRDGASEQVNEWERERAKWSQFTRSKRADRINITPIGCRYGPILGMFTSVESETVFAHALEARRIQSIAAWRLTRLDDDSLRV
jgi:hypothetical protein